MNATKSRNVISLNTWLAFGLFIALVITFGLYIYSVKQVDFAHDMRLKSFLATEELRQSSDDLTRMVRSYIATGNPAYKQYYQDIIAIGDGKAPRPKNYTNSYWELILTGKQPLPRATEPPISMLELFRANGFTEYELDVLKASKINSDALSATERAAMALIEQPGNDREANRQRALSMVFGDDYNNAKVGILQPINQFYQLQDKRTLQAVYSAECQAAIILVILIGFGLSLMFMLWRINQAVRITLGGTADEVHRQIKRIGNGDVSTTFNIVEGGDSSVLTWLAETQRNLQQIREERVQMENAKQESDERFRHTFKLIPNPLTLQTDKGIMLDCSDAFCETTGFSREEIIGRNTLELGIWVNPQERNMMREQLMQRGQIDDFEFQLRHRNGDIKTMQISARYLTKEPEPIVLSVAHDITARKQAERALQESAQHTQTILDNMFDGVITINAQGIIESFNTAASTIFGYPQHEVLGENITLLMPSHYKSQHVRYLQHHDESLESEVLNTLREVEGLRKDGEVFPMSLSITKIWCAGKTTFVGVIRDISQQRRDEEEIYRLAFYDPLTNLPNRRLLYDRLQQAIHTSCRTDQHGALMFLDLDHFKQLNDSLGHDVGDTLLQQVAARLQACVREGDSVARMGGDEFVMLIEALSLYPNEAAAQAEMIAHKILASLAQPYRLREHTYVITPSVGIVVFLHQQETLDELIKKADVAMYQAKTAGRNNARFFDPTMQAAVSVRVALEKNMRLALEREEFLLHYQLQVNREGIPTGVEALVRWNHSEHGMVSPAAFIPLAEETGMILTLGQWVLETACEQLVKWAATPAMAAWTMAVNVSISQFAQPSFVANVAKALKKTGANPHLLKLELTESMLAKDVDDVVVKMFEIKALGVTFSLDDFGTGYSSLSYLKRLPLDQLKIDQSFVRDLLTDSNDATIARTIIALGHSLSLNVIAEGVETLEQRDALAAMGCDAYQGYYFARPVIAAELLQTINKLPC